MESQSETSVTMAPPPPTAETSNQATVESAALGGIDSTCNATSSTLSTDNAEASADNSDANRDKSLELAADLMAKGSEALKDNDFCEATDCFSRALEIRVAQHGELAMECVKAYYKYGCALLYKAQEEADPLGAVPKKDGENGQGSDKDVSLKKAVNGESSTASVSSNAEQGASSNKKEDARDDDSDGKDQEDDDSDVEDLPDADEDESDLDLAWKMLDVARAIVEKNSADTIEKVDILSALAEVALEREDIETSLSDYQKALSILERLVEPDDRQIAELNFRICLCLELGSRPEEAIPYCQKAISVCKSRVQRLGSQVKGMSVPASSSTAPESDQSIEQLSNVSDITVADKETEIETLTGLSSELEKKLEDLQQVASNPKSILADILGLASAKARANEKNTTPAVMNSSQIGTVNSSAGFDSPTVSTAHTNGSGGGVTHLGVVGRGVKRVLMSTTSTGSSPMKKPSTDKGDGSAS